MLLAWDPQLLYDALIRFPIERYRAVNSVDLTLFGFVSLVLAAIAWLLGRCLRQGDILYLVLLQACLLLTTLQRRISPTSRSRPFRDSAWSPCWSPSLETIRAQPVHSCTEFSAFSCWRRFPPC